MARTKAVGWGLRGMGLKEEDAGGLRRERESLRGSLLLGLALLLFLPLLVDRCAMMMPLAVFPAATQVLGQWTWGWEQNCNFGK